MSSCTRLHGVFVLETVSDLADHARREKEVMIGISRPLFAYETGPLPFSRTTVEANLWLGPRATSKLGRVSHGPAASNPVWFVRLSPVGAKLSIQLHGDTS